MSEERLQPQDIEWPGEAPWPDAARVRDIGDDEVVPEPSSHAPVSGVSGVAPIVVPIHGVADELIVPEPSDPMAVARRFLEERYTRGGDLLLRHHRGQFHLWTGPHWPEDEDRRVKSELFQWLEPMFYVDAKNGHTAWKPNPRKVADVAEALAAIGHVPEAQERPCWLDGSEATGVVSMANGLLDLTTRELRPHTPAFFNEFSVSFAYNQRARGTERWVAFLHQLWGDDEDSIMALQEVFGYLVSGDTRQQKIVMLVGPPRSGKGTIGRVLTGLLGAHNVAAPTLASLTQNFGLQCLIGKPLGLISDARLGTRADGTTAVERLLSISGEDSMTVDRKYKDPWTGRLPSRFVILTNELPRFTDASGALASRFVILVLNESFLGRENPLLTDELLDEAPAIFNWALEGLDRLRARGHFAEPASSIDAMRHLRDLASPVAAFVRDYCVIGPDYEIAKDDLWTAWKTWADDEGIPKGSKEVLIRNLRAAHPGIKQARRGPRDGERLHTLVGITIDGTPDTPDTGSPRWAA